MEVIYTESLKQLYNETEKDLKALKSGDADVRLRIVDVAIDEKMKKRKEEERKAKEYAVLKAHVTADGTSRSIHVLNKNGKTLWKTRLAGKKDLTATTRDALIDKLYDHYRDQILPPEQKKSYSIESEFQKILDTYKLEKNPTDNTIYKHEKNFKRFLLGTDFAKKELCEIEELDVLEFTYNLVHNEETKLKAKAFDEYVTLIKLIFRNAKKTKPALITSNPVAEIDFSVYKVDCEQTKAQSQNKILSPEEIERIREICLKRIKKNVYYVRGYMILLAIETGMRVGELCSLRWEDIIWKPTKESPAPCIYIHTQLLSHYDKKRTKLLYEIVDWTKGEKKKKNHVGRKFPMTRNISEILITLMAKQKSLGIYNENGFVFEENGNFVTTVSYEKCLKRICKSLGYEVTNNHALRMSLNSNVLIPRGIPETIRALWLGHSVRVNIEHYSFAEKDDMQYANRLDDMAPNNTILNEVVNQYGSDLDNVISDPDIIISMDERHPIAI